MAKFEKGPSLGTLGSRGLRYKLRIAFSLMSVIPLLVCIYLFFYYSPYISNVPFSFSQVTISIFVSAIIAVIGFWVAKQIVDPILEISSEAKSIAKGEFHKIIEIYREDEIGDLGNALNQLTRRIRDNMDELRNYGERTQAINSEINKRVVVLSGILQISNLITQGANLKEIFDISVSKLAQLKNAAWVILVVKDQIDSLKICAQYGISGQLNEFLINAGLLKIFNSVLLNKNGYIINKQNEVPENVELKQAFNTPDIIFIPVFRHSKIIGFLGVGSADLVTEYNDDDLELLGIFAKQMSIAIENDYLANRLVKLEIKDTLTGLYNKNFIINRLEEEIKRAMIYQRPCAFLLFSIDKFHEFSCSFGQLSGEQTLKKVSKLLEESCGEIDRVARYGDSDFAIVLPEKTKKQSAALAEDIRKKINETFSKEEDKKNLSISVAVSENPIDGSSSKDLVEKAEKLLALAKEEKNVIKS